jgi:ferredoxin-NADP reductase
VSANPLEPDHYPVEEEEEAAPDGEEDELVKVGSEAFIAEFHKQAEDVGQDHERVHFVVANLL